MRRPMCAAQFASATSLRPASISSGFGLGLRPLLPLASEHSGLSTTLRYGTSWHSGNLDPGYSALLCMWSTQWLQPPPCQRESAPAKHPGVGEGAAANRENAGLCVSARWGVMSLPLRWRGRSMKPTGCCVAGRSTMKRPMCAALFAPVPCRSHGWGGATFCQPSSRITKPRSSSGSFCCNHL